MSIKDHLVADAKVWSRLWSMRFAIATTIFSSAIGAFVLMPDRLKDIVPVWLLHTMVYGDVTTSIGCGLSRLWKQAALTPTVVPPVSVPPNAAP